MCRKLQRLNFVSFPQDLWRHGQDHRYLGLGEGEDEEVLYQEEMEGEETV